MAAQQGRCSHKCNDFVQNLAEEFFPQIFNLLIPDWL